MGPLACLPALAVALLSAPGQAGPPVRRVPTTFGEMAYWDEGSGDQTLVLVHGLPTSKELWADVVPALALDHRVITLDINNFGDSEKIGRILDHEQRAAAIDELRATLDIDGFVLIAHDLGASVAVEYMGKYAEHVDQLVLLSSPVYPDFEEPPPVRLLRRPVLGRVLLRLAPRMLYRVAMRTGMTHDERITPRKVEAFAGFYQGPQGAQALYENLWWGTPEVEFAEYPDIMRGLDVPTLLLHGDQDPWIPEEHAHRMDRDIPDSKLVLIEDGSHFLPLDAPADVAGEVLAFIRSNRTMEPAP